ncbi:hypothetical protein N0V90_009528 [Kalmusia sp. IMI 367209]|nr:hypothetical protein N0V90_009528 [Kalmusia sp. IMI 367209]
MSQGIGEYLNKCYWDNTCALLGTDQYLKALWDDLRKDMPTGRDEKRYTREDLLESLSKLETKFQTRREQSGPDDDPEIDQSIYDKIMRDVAASWKSGIKKKQRLSPDARREELQKRLAKSLRYYGLDAGIEMSDDESTTDADSNPSTPTSAQEMQDRDTQMTGHSNSAIPPKQSSSSGQSTLGISPKNAKLWLETL